MYSRIYVDLIDEGCTVKLENKDSLAFSNTQQYVQVTNTDGP